MKSPSLVVSQNLTGTKDNQLPGFIVHTPNPQPVRHTRIFSKEEVIKALSLYLEVNGVSVPEGKTFLWGLEPRDCHGDSEESVTLVIDSISK